MQHPTELITAWMQAKQDESEAVARRRIIEDKLAEFMDIDQQKDGTSNATVGQFQVKATTRLNRKVDADQVQQLAAEHGIPYTELQRLFRWKPEINTAAWKASHPDLISILSKAVTTTASRPSFSITIKE